MEVAQDILTIVFLRIPEWLLHHLKVVAVLAALTIILIAGARYYGSTARPAPDYSKTAPVTPYVATMTYPGPFYYVVTYQTPPGQTILTDYYTYQGKWVHKTSPLPFKAGLINVRAR